MGLAGMSERRLRMLRLRSEASRSLVSALVAWASWSSTHVECGFGAGVDVGAAALDSHLRRDALRGPGVGFGCLGNLVVDPCGGAASGPAWIEL